MCFRCIPCPPQHLALKCRVLAAKHNSSGSLSGCHFTKPGRLLEITSICGKTNERVREDGVKHDFHPQLCPQEPCFPLNGMINQPK